MARSCKWEKVRGVNQWAARTTGKKGVLIHHEHHGYQKKIWVIREYKDIDHPFRDVSKLVGPRFKTAKEAKNYADKHLCGRKR